MKEHDIKDHPAVKLLIALGGVLGDAACDLKLDGTQLLCTDQLEPSTSSLGITPRTFDRLLFSGSEDFKPEFSFGRAEFVPGGGGGEGGLSFWS